MSELISAIETIGMDEKDRDKFAKRDQKQMQRETMKKQKSRQAQANRRWGANRDDVLNEATRGMGYASMNGDAVRERLREKLREKFQNMNPEWQNESVKRKVNTSEVIITPPPKDMEFGD